MGAFMGGSKAPLAAEFMDLSGLNKAHIQQNLGFFLSWDCSFYAHFFCDVISVSA